MKSHSRSTQEAAMGSAGGFPPGFADAGLWPPHVETLPFHPPVKFRRPWKRLRTPPALCCARWSRPLGTGHLEQPRRCLGCSDSLRATGGSQERGENVLGTNRASRTTKKARAGCTRHQSPVRSLLQTHPSALGCVCQTLLPAAELGPGWATAPPCLPAPRSASRCRWGQRLLSLPSASAMISAFQEQGWVFFFFWRAGPR